MYSTSHWHYFLDSMHLLLHMLSYAVGMGEEGKDKHHPCLFLRMKGIEDSSVGLQFVTIELLHNLVVQFEAKEEK